jgi:hypothetical protein
MPSVACQSVVGRTFGPCCEGPVINSRHTPVAGNYTSHPSKELAFDAARRSWTPQI